MSIRPEYFDALYAANDDPWSFTERWYERRKRALTIAALPHARYSRAFEIGCSIGTLTADQIDDAQTLLDSVPARLRAAAHDPAQAPLLLFALLLNADPEVRNRQHHLIRTSTLGASAAPMPWLEIETALAHLTPEQRLPLVQVALPALRHLAAPLDDFLGVLDGLVHADERISTFEFALQKLIARSLELNRSPGNAIVQYHSFHAVTAEIAVVLSALARAATTDPTFAAQAFATGAAQLKQVAAKLRYVETSRVDFASLDSALDKIAAASLPIRQATLVAAAHVVGADGQVLITEAELLRAVACALDCPMPPLRSKPERE